MNSIWLKKFLCNHQQKLKINEQTLKKTEEDDITDAVILIDDEDDTTSLYLIDGVLKQAT